MALSNYTVYPSQTGWSLVCSSPITCLTCSFLRGETGDQSAATKGKRWTTAGSQNCQVITKVCIEHWHKHRCAHTDVACSMCLDTHTHTGTLLSFLSITTFVLAKERADCLLLWSWPSWWGNCSPNYVGEVWNQTPSALAKSTMSTEAEWATVSEKLNCKLITGCCIS